MVCSRLTEHTPTDGQTCSCFLGRLCKHMRGTNARETHGQGSGQTGGTRDRSTHRVPPRLLGPHPHANAPCIHDDLLRRISPPDCTTDQAPQETFWKSRPRSLREFLRVLSFPFCLHVALEGNRREGRNVLVRTMRTALSKDLEEDGF